MYLYCGRWKCFSESFRVSFLCRLISSFDYQWQNNCRCVNERPSLLHVDFPRSQCSHARQILHTSAELLWKQSVFGRLARGVEYCACDSANYWRWGSRHESVCAEWRVELEQRGWLSQQSDLWHQSGLGSQSCPRDRSVDAIVNNGAVSAGRGRNYRSRQVQGLHWDVSLPN